MHYNHRRPRNNTGPAMAQLEPQYENAWHLKKGSYLGDVSALCFLYRPWESSFPYLLAGTGAELFLYDIESGQVLCSSHAFDGIRVHGIHSSCYLIQDFDPSCSMRISAVTVAIFGERRVKLFDVQLSGESESKRSKGQISLDLLQILPIFSHWVMDVRFLKGLNKEGLKENFRAEEKVSDSLLVIGLSDNSVHIWNIAQSYQVLEVKCSERCLLYSMSLWGDSIKTLCVASGTIYNEILIWKIISQQAEVGVLCSDAPPCCGTIIQCTNHKLYNCQYGSVLLNRLTGHEGSIFRIAWSHNGLKLVSASDDRSARVWICKFNGKDIRDSWAVSHSEIIAGPILFGHSARIWDCCISDVIIITASEDCTCRIWGSNGQHVATIRGHIGRGVWRCVYDPGTSVLITAGSDSSIKMRHLKTQNDADDKMEVFKICLQKDISMGSRGFTDSKSEYVRCLQLAQESYLYVATNLGCLHCIDLTVPGEERWTTIVKSDDKEPIVCLDLLAMKSPSSLVVQQDWVAIGDGKGRATVVQLISSNLKHEVLSSIVWSAERPRQLLGIYWCKSLGHRFVFTTDPKGGIKLWRLWYPSRKRSESHEMVEVDASKEGLASLVAEFVSNFSARVVCIDASFEDELLICGDQRGNIIVFKFPMRSLAIDDMIVKEKVQTFCSFKGAHGISTVVSISVARSNGNQMHICSTGKDGCICSFIFDNDAVVDSSNGLLFTGIKNVPEITMVEGVVNYINIMGDGVQKRFAAGFTSVDFLLWDLTNESELLRVSCGGWRRPHSYFIGVMPELQNCFAYIKDHMIYVLRNWVPDDQIKPFPQSLHTQFHGREIHSVHFIPMPTSLFYGHNDHPFPKISWIATGSEDGTVRLTRYSSKQIDKPSLSLILGEHVGGSAVRSIATVSKIYTLRLEGKTQQSDVTCDMENRDASLLLLSVGAKQVLTSWLLKWVKDDVNCYEDEASSKLDLAYALDFEKSSLEGNYTLSFQWLSTYMQPRTNKPTKKLGSGEKQCHPNGTVPTLMMPECVIGDESGQAEVVGGKLNPNTDEGTQDDWRYLAVTAFMVQAIDTRSTVCFAVTASSNGTLSMHALLLPDRLWFEVAVLDHEIAPVLALQHVVIPLSCSGSDSMQNIYLVFSGATSGNIAVWDLTDVVNDFTLKISSCNSGKDIIAQRRPRTGRGSQGGRRWRFLRSQDGVSEVTLGKVDDANVDICNPLSGTASLQGLGEETSSNAEVNSDFKHSEEQDDKLTRQPESGTVKEFENGTVEGQNGCSINIDMRGRNEVIPMERLHNEIPKLHPLHVFYHAHQSGVNCLHISTLNDNGSMKTENADSLYCVVSGGDDQALHIASFSLDAQLIENKVMSNTTWKERKEPSTYGDFGNCGVAGPNIVNTASDDKSSEHKAVTAVYKLTCLSQEVISSAHSSSIKGVWTDGHWVFSTGLDQRIRCWRFSFYNNVCTLREHFSSIINVPEPEALHTIASEERNYYQIAIVGRGMQIVEFLGY